MARSCKSLRIWPNGSGKNRVNRGMVPENPEVLPEDVGEEHLRLDHDATQVLTGTCYPPCELGCNLMIVEAIIKAVVSFELYAPGTAQHADDCTYPSWRHSSCQAVHAPIVWTYSFMLSPPHHFDLLCLTLLASGYVFPVAFRKPRTRYLHGQTLPSHWSTRLSGFQRKYTNKSSML